MDSYAPLLKFAAFALLICVVKYGGAKIVYWWKSTFYHGLVIFFFLSVAASAQDAGPVTDSEAIHAIYVFARDGVEYLRVLVVASGVLVGLLAARVAISRWSL